MSPTKEQPSTTTSAPEAQRQEAVEDEALTKEARSPRTEKKEWSPSKDRR
jgi:hypothetical protein